MIGHSGDSNDLDYLRAIADQGAILGCDRFGIPHFNPDADRIRTLTALLGEGYADRIVLVARRLLLLRLLHGRRQVREEKPDYLLIERTILPALLEAGVTQEQIDTMMVDNPRRYFS